MSSAALGAPKQAAGEWVLASEKPVADTKFPCRVRVGTEAVVILQTSSGYRGVEKACPHQGASWMTGELIAAGTILKCPLHSFAFRLSDGKGVNCPGLRIKVYDVKAVDDRLYVHLKPPVPSPKPPLPAQPS